MDLSYLFDYIRHTYAQYAFNAKTGEILAMASYPNYNLNSPYDLSAYYTEEEIGVLLDKAKDDAVIAAVAEANNYTNEDKERF